MTREPGWSFKPIGNNNNKTFWVFYAFSAQLFWFNSCFFSQLSYNCLDGWISSFNTLWSCSPKCKKCWCKLGHFPHIKALTDSALSLNEEIAIDCNKEQERPLSRLQKKKKQNLNVAGDSQVCNQASEMWTELQPHFTEDFLQMRRETHGPRANTESHGCPTDIHCALLHLPVISLLVCREWSCIHNLT